MKKIYKIQNPTANPLIISRESFSNTENANKETNIIDSNDDERTNNWLSDTWSDTFRGFTLVITLQQTYQCRRSVCKNAERPSITSRMVTVMPENKNKQINQATTSYNDFQRTIQTKGNFHDRKYLNLPTIMHC